MKRLRCIPAALLVLFGFALITTSVHSRSIGRGGNLNFAPAQAVTCGIVGFPPCPCTDDHVEAQGDAKDDNHGTTDHINTDARKLCNGDTEGFMDMNDDKGDVCKS